MFLAKTLLKTIRKTMHSQSDEKLMEHTHKLTKIKREAMLAGDYEVMNECHDLYIEHLDLLKERDISLDTLHEHISSH